MTIDMLEDRLYKRLEQRALKGNLRRLQNAETQRVDFLSNDYLGLAQNQNLHKKILQSLQQANLPLWGSTGSRLLSGNTAAAEQLEYQLADYFKAETALLFNSGFAANAALPAAVATRKDVIFYDELVHASIKTGFRMSFAQTQMFKHNDMNDLAKKLKRWHGRAECIFVMTESIFSMDGDSPFAYELAELCKEYNAYLIIDEAHSTGVYGEYGEGWCVEEQIEQAVFARVHTFGKAFGSQGACIVGNNILKLTLINFALEFIYSTAMPAQNLIVLSESLDYIKSEEAKYERNKLFENISYFNKKLNTLKIRNRNKEGINSPIQILPIPDVEACKSLAEQLQRKGFEVRAILSPTVPKGKERIRICLHSFNTQDDIDKLLQTLKEAMK
ncbi:MAG: 8-amino-7-oxononanoate synthase [Bernardetiaceae bacterium]|nr:8-amino-7-oxononanoate synthase [Bernardetiaceae bacterium]